MGMSVAEADARTAPSSLRGAVYVHGHTEAIYEQRGTHSYGPYIYELEAAPSLEKVDTSKKLTAFQKWWEGVRTQLRRG